MAHTITSLIGRQILDSRGSYTIECSLILNHDVCVIASVPSGASRSSHEAHELRDKEGSVSSAIHTINTIIAPLIVGSEPDLFLIDRLMIEHDGTADKSALGANAILAVSIAVCKAQAYANNCELYEHIAYLAGYDTISIPCPFFNLLNGGLHTATSFPIQEIMCVPLASDSLTHALEYGLTVFRLLDKLLKDNGIYYGIGDEGGWAAYFSSSYEAFDYMTTALDIAAASYENTIPAIACDMAASQFFNPQTQLYSFDNNIFTAQEMITWYDDLFERYPLYALEDGLDQNAWDDWHALTTRLSPRIHIVGDDIFATNSTLITRGIEKNVATAVIIKPNQIGTVTETLNAIKLCHDNNKIVIVSHRSGETNDSFIADLAVGTRAHHIKVGGLSRGERIAKYNRLLAIESQLVMP